MTDRQDLVGQIASAGARMDPGLSDRDVERLIEGARRRRRRRTVRRASLVALGVSLIIGAAGLLLRQPMAPGPVAGGATKPQVMPAATLDRTVRLPDGSTATPLEAGSEIEILGQSRARIGLALKRGSGRFEVTPQPERAFSVRAGDVTVTVVGTAFTVERIADRVGVSVERGTVRVDWAGGFRLLGQGQSGWFPPLGTNAEPGPRPRPIPPPAKGKVAAEPAIAEAKVPRPARDESAEGLLLAADNMRLAGHPEQGAALLRKLLREHGADPRAPLAAFTLGRLLLMELGRPGEAATAFAEVRRLSPGGAFAEDALAREVEAFRQAGQAEQARARAAEYLRLYPGGRRAAMVRSLGGIE